MEQENAVTEEELSKAALMERYPESSMSYDWLAWYKLRDVYRDFKAGRIGREEGEEQKKSVFSARQNDITRYEAHKSAEIRLGQFWAKIEEAGRNYMKDPTIDNADRFVRAVYGAGRLEHTEREETKNERD